MKEDGLRIKTLDSFYSSITIKTSLLPSIRESNNVSNLESVKFLELFLSILLNELQLNAEATIKK
jgi:hypothetical protein